MDVMELWWLGLAIFSVVVIVVAVLLGLIIATAKQIDKHAKGIWVVGKQIAGNTVSIWMLERTNKQLGTVVQSMKGLQSSTAAIDEKLQTVTEGQSGG